MGENRINIGFISSKQYLKYAKAMVRSLIDYNTGPIDIYILSTELENRDIVFFNNVRDNVTTRLICADAQIFDSLKETGHYGIYTYFRTICYMFLPDNIERILWLDLDIIINGDISEFYYTDFERNVLVGCEDSLGTLENGLSADLIKEYKVDKYQRMFNAGILLMNIKLLKEENPKSKIMELIGKKELLKFADQDILNVLYGKRIKYVSNKYNFMTMGKNEYTIQPSIIHYAGCIKPDNFRYIDNYSDKFWEYYKIDHRASYFKFMILNKLYRIIRPIFRR